MKRGLDIIRDIKGQNMVEFALIAALFLAILFGILEFGRAWFYSNHLTNSVRAAARYGAVLGNASTVGAAQTMITAFVVEEVSGGGNDEGIPAIPGDEAIKSVTVSFVDPETGGARGGGEKPEKGDTITVTVVYEFTVLSGYIIPNFFGVDGTKDIVRSAAMQYEGTAT